MAQSIKTTTLEIDEHVSLNTSKILVYITVFFMGLMSIILYFTVFTLPHGNWENDFYFVNKSNKIQLNTMGYFDIIAIIVTIILMILSLVSIKKKPLYGKRANFLKFTIFTFVSLIMLFSIFGFANVISLHNMDQAHSSGWMFEWISYDVLGGQYCEYSFAGCFVLIINTLAFCFYPITVGVLWMKKHNIIKTKKEMTVVPV